MRTRLRSKKGQSTASDAQTLLQQHQTPETTIESPAIIPEIHPNLQQNSKQKSSNGLKTNTTENIEKSSKSRYFSRFLFKCIIYLFVFLFLLWLIFLILMATTPSLLLSFTYLSFFAQSKIPFNSNYCNIHNFIDRLNLYPKQNFTNYNIDIDVFKYSDNDCNGNSNDQSNYGFADQIFNEMCYHGKAPAWLVKSGSDSEGTNFVGRNDYQDDKVLVIYAHGIGYDRCNGYRLDGYKTLLHLPQYNNDYNLSYDLLTFDYIGFGNSTGSNWYTVTDTQVTDTMTSILYWAKTNLSYKNVIIWSHSMGNGALLNSLKENSHLYSSSFIDFIILDSPFSDGQQMMIEDHFLAKPLKFLYGFDRFPFDKTNENYYEKFILQNTVKFDKFGQFNNIENFKHFCDQVNITERQDQNHKNNNNRNQNQILILHSKNDKIIPFSSARTLYDSVKDTCLKKSISVDFVEDSDFYVNEITQKLAKVYDLDVESYDFGHNDQMRYGAERWGPYVKKFFSSE